MAIDRKNKYKKKSDEPVSIGDQPSSLVLPLDVSLLDMICSFVMSENKSIRKVHYLNLKSLMNKVDIEPIASDYEKSKRIHFINKVLEGRLSENISNPELLLSYVNGGFADKNYMEIKDFSEMTDGDISWLNRTISAALSTTHISKYMEEFHKLYETFKFSKPLDRMKLVPMFENLTKDIQARFRESKAEETLDAVFSLREGVFQEQMRKLHQESINPSSRLVTGMQGFNEMTGGGLYGRKVYCLFGLPGEGKSLTMLDLAFQVKQHNRNFQTKTPGKIPCIVILTMENGKEETMARLYNMAARPERIETFSEDELIRIAREEGNLVMTDDNPIDILIKFVPGNTKDTSYLYELYDDLDDVGYECILIVQDYIKKIKPSMMSGDVRIDLGNVIVDFKNFAEAKQIPVLTASQLNRDATKQIDEGRKSSKADLLRLFGRSNIGESMLILENIDFGCMLAPEYDRDTGMKYLGMQRIKCRYFAGNREHMYQPYKMENPIKLIEDEGLAMPLFRETLRNDLPLGANNKNGGYKMSTIVSIGDGMVGIEDTYDNIFVGKVS